jgi:large subunit ribosomal protein L10
MAKSKQSKEQVVQELIGKLKNAKSVAVTSYRGLDVNSTQALRAKCREENVDFVSVKRTLLDKAMVGAGIEGFSLDGYDGIVAVALSEIDEVAPSRIIFEFSKNHEALKLHNGLLEGFVIAEEKVMGLAQLPSKDQLLAKLVGSMKSPINGFAGVLSGTLRGFVQVLSQIKDQKES